MTMSHGGFQPPDEGFTAIEYLRLYKQALADPSYKLSPIDQEARYNEMVERIKVTPPDQLPNWETYKRAWITDYVGQLIPSGKAFISPYSGKLYSLDGTPYDPEAAALIIKKEYQEPGLSDYEKRQLANAERSYALDIAQFQQKTRESDQASQLKLQQMQDERAAGLMGENQANERAQRQKDFELWKSQTMLALEQPADWIKRWEVMHTPSPVAQPQGNWYEGPLGALAGKRWEDMTPLERGAVNAMDATINPRTENQLSFYGNPRQEGLPAGVENTGAPFPEPSWMPLSTQEARQIIADINQKAGILASAQVSETPSRTPPAPSWLPQFAPSQRAGQTITRGDIVTPSGQQWNRTPWSVQQGLRGYADWSGGRAYEDILGEMESMLPKTPRGAGYASWRPRRT